MDNSYSNTQETNAPLSLREMDALYLNSLRVPDESTNLPNKKRKQSACDIEDSNRLRLMRTGRRKDKNSPSKDMTRIETWLKIHRQKDNLHFNVLFNRIPRFEDSNLAAKKLAQLPEFKAAKNIRINNDNALFNIRLETIADGTKTLFLPGKEFANSLFYAVDVPPRATLKQMKHILYAENIQEHLREVPLEEKVKLDMVVIGSVLVSPEGYRVGGGDGVTDLHIGTLIELASITYETVIVTMVHDMQVSEDLNINIFKEHDAPIDIIVTPTRVIRVPKRLKRPTGIYWDILTEKRVNAVPFLKKLKKDAEERSGRKLVLREEMPFNDIFEHKPPKKKRRSHSLPRNTYRRRLNDTSLDKTNNPLHKQRFGSTRTCCKRKSKHLTRPTRIFRPKPAFSMRLNRFVEPIDSYKHKYTSLKYNHQCNKAFKYLLSAQYLNQRLNFVPKIEPSTNDDVFDPINMSMPPFRPRMASSGMPPSIINTNSVKDVDMPQSYYSPYRTGIPSLNINDNFDHVIALTSLSPEKKSKFLAQLTRSRL